MKILARAALVAALDFLTKLFAKQAWPEQIVSSRGFPWPAVVAGLLVFILLRDYFRLQGWGIALIFGGALANLLDRIPDGRVTDFIDLGIVTFNLADLAIWGGIILLIVRRP